MKLYSAFVALCVFHPNGWETTAFSVQAPKGFRLRGETCQYAVSPSLSYLGNINQDGPQRSESAPQPEPAPLQYADASESTGAALKSAPIARDTGSSVSAVTSSAAKNIWDTTTEVKVQGDTLRTWSFPTPSVQRVQVLMKTDGRPMNADLELWQGPDNTPQKVGIYIEDGSLTPFSALIETPRGTNAIAIRNTANMEFPLSANVEGEEAGDNNLGLVSVVRKLADFGSSNIVQGGALRTWAFEPSVESIQVLLRTDGRPLNARLELLQGPNNNKQVIELYTEDGMERPFFAIIETPGTGNVCRIINTSSLEYPMTATVEPYVELA